MYNEIVRLRLKEERRKAGYSQEKLAEMTGIDINIIKKIEAKRREPDIENLGILSEFYNIPTDYFFGLGKKNNNTQI